MSKENKTVELKEEDLQEISGGFNIPPMFADCPCGNKKYTISVVCPPNIGDLLKPECGCGYKATYVGSNTVSFYNPTTNDTQTVSIHS